jgi:hypothetical protein
MATPRPRPTTDEPPALHDRAIQDLSFIRRTMEGAASFTDVPGWGLVAIGATAVAAAFIAAQQGSPRLWITTWLGEAALATVIGLAATWRKMHRIGHEPGTPWLSLPARKFLLGFWPAIFAGVLLTYSLLDVRTLLGEYGGDIPRGLPGIWLLMYGVGVTTAGAVSVRAVPLMGLGLMAIGATALINERLSADFLLGLGFGVWQIACGLWIARRHGG